MMTRLPGTTTLRAALFFIWCASHQLLCISVEWICCIPEGWDSLGARLKMELEQPNFRIMCGGRYHHVWKGRVPLKFTAYAGSGSPRRILIRQALSHIAVK